MGWNKHARGPRARSRFVAGALGLLALGLLSLVPQSAASAAPSDKVIVCHATASNTNPWVRIEVSENALPAHLGLVGSSHQHQHSLGRHDFVWTEEYDQDCVKIPVPDPISVTCSGLNDVPSPVQAVADDGTITSIPCEAVHSEVTLPIGVHRIVCTRGTTAAPYWQQYRLVPGGRSYGVNCLAGDVVDLGVQGGRFQVVCPTEGSVSMYRYSLFGGLQSYPTACTPDLVTPTPQNPLGAATESIDWNTSSAGQMGWVRCPAAGSLSMYYLGEGLPISSASAMTAYPCTAGQKVDVTRMVLTA